jgi:hypothetical protein
VDTVADQLVDMKMVGREVLAVADLMPKVEREQQDKEIKVETEIMLALVIIMLEAVVGLVLLVALVLVIML